MSIQKSELTPTPDEPIFSPKTPFVATISGTALRTAAVRTLQPGSYAPIGANSQGVWYIGPAESLHISYPESKRSDGKTVLHTFTGGVVLARDGAESRMFHIPSTLKIYVLESAATVDNGLTGHRSPDTVQTPTQGMLPSNPPMGTKSEIVGGALGGAIAGALLDYDAKGLQALPRFDSDSGSQLPIWLQSK